MHLRVAEPRDGQRLAAIDQLTWSPAVTPVPRWVPDAHPSAETAPGDVLVAEDDGRVAGYVQLRPLSALASHRHVAEVCGLAVDPALQGRGVGRALVEAATLAAARRGATRLTLRVLGSNPGARRLYEACGFVVEGVLRGEFVIEGREVDDVLMAPRLDPADAPHRGGSAG